MQATQGYSSKLQCDLNFAFEQGESEVNLHKATSLPESLSNVSPVDRQCQTTRRININKYQVTFDFCVCLMKQQQYHAICHPSLYGTSCLIRVPVSTKVCSNLLQGVHILFLIKHYKKENLVLHPTSINSYNFEVGLVYGV